MDNEREPANARMSDVLDLVPKPPNADGSTMCTVRWMIETPGGWLGSWDRTAFDAYISAVVAAGRERCAKSAESEIAMEVGVPQCLAVGSRLERRG